MKRKSDILTAELEADYASFMAYLDATRDLQVKQVTAMQAARPEAKESQEPAPQRIFAGVWIGEDGRMMFDFEVFGTGMTIREWEAAHDGK